MKTRIGDTSDRKATSELFVKKLTSNQNRRSAAHQLTWIRSALLTLGLSLSLFSAPARAAVLSACTNEATTEGVPVLSQCGIFNFGLDPVKITGVFAFSYSIAGDASDNITSIQGVGPAVPFVIAPFGFQPYQFLLGTPPGELDPKPDVGLNDLSAIFDATDTVTHRFAPGLSLSAVIAVYDVGLVPQVPQFPWLPYYVGSYDDYVNYQQDAKDRGWTTYDTPEPSSLLLVGSAVLGLSGFLRKRVLP